MTSQSTLLLKGGTLLIHDEDNHVVPTRADLLIEGNTITKIERDISSPGPPARVVDCTFKIISPGFISTHAHLWQTQFKGLHPNHTLVEYLPSGCYAGSFYTLRDLFWGQLAGAMECVDGGTTTVVDHSHLNLGADYREISPSFCHHHGSPARVTIPISGSRTGPEQTNMRQKANPIPSQPRPPSRPSPPLA